MKKTVGNIYRWKFAILCAAGSMALAIAVPAGGLTLNTSSVLDFEIGPGRRAGFAER